MHRYGLPQPAREQRGELVTVQSPGHGRRAVMLRFHPAFFTQRLFRQEGVQIIEHQQCTGKAPCHGFGQGADLVFGEVHEKPLGGDEYRAIRWYGIEPGGVERTERDVQMAFIGLDEAFAQGDGFGQVHRQPEGLGVFRFFEAKAFGFQSLAQVDDDAVGVLLQEFGDFLVEELRAHAVRGIGGAEAAIVVVIQRAVDFQTFGVVDAAVGACRFAGAVVQGPEGGFGDAGKVGNGLVHVRVSCRGQEWLRISDSYVNHVLAAGRSGMCHGLVRHGERFLVL